MAFQDVILGGMIFIRLHNSSKHDPSEEWAWEKLERPECAQFAMNNGELLYINTKTDLTMNH